MVLSHHQITAYFVNVEIKSHVTWRAVCSSNFQEYQLYHHSKMVPALHHKAQALAISKIWFFAVSGILAEDTLSLTFCKMLVVCGDGVSVAVTLQLVFLKVIFQTHFITQASITACKYSSQVQSASHSNT